MSEIIIKFLQTALENEALNPENSQDSDDTYAIFSKTYNPLFRIQGSHDGSDLGTITNVEGFIEYHTVGIVNDFCQCSFLLPGYLTEYGIAFRELYARETKGIQYEGRSWSYGFPPWSYFAHPELTGKIVNYIQIGAPDRGTFHIDQIGFRITYINKNVLAFSANF